MMTNWKDLADAKRQAILDAIPAEWRLQSVPSREEEKDVTGNFMQKQGYLTSTEIEITETDVVGIVGKVAAGTWTAVSVAKAFCHRAAIAHQLVSVQRHINPVTHLCS